MHSRTTCAAAFGCREVLGTQKSLALLMLFLLAGCDGVYQHTRDSRGRDSRLNKLTGKLETLQSDGSWMTARQEAEAYEAQQRAERQPLPPQEAAKVTGQGWFVPNSRAFGVKISNDSAWAITEMDVVVTIKESVTGQTIDKMQATVDCLETQGGSFLAQLQNRGPILPHQTKEPAPTRVERIPENGQGYEWHIAKIRGYPHKAQ